jgi:hypothetical protein
MLCISSLFGFGKPMVLLQFRSMMPNSSAPTRNSRINPARSRGGSVDSHFKRYFCLHRIASAKAPITDLGRSRLRGSLAAVQMTGIGVGRTSIQI